MRYFTLIITFLLLAQLAMGQTYIKNVGLIEGVTSTATAAGTTTLTVNSQTNQMFTGVANQTVVLPDATTLPIGRRFYITNRSTGIVTVNTNGGAGLTTIAPDTQKTFIVKTVGTAAGTWDVTNWNVSSVSGILPIANGGTNKALTLSAGGIPYFDADSFEVLSAGSSGQILRSGGAGAPTWSTATFPATAGTSGTLLQSNGTNWVNTTATYPGVATSAGTILRADGTNWLATTATFPNTTTINQILYSSANNVVGGITASATSALVTNSSSVPAFTSGAVANRLLRTDGATISFAQADLTTDVTGVLPIANGGSNKALTLSAGGMLWTDADSFEVLSAGTGGQILTSGGSSTPAWVTLLPLANGGTNKNMTAVNGGVVYTDADSQEVSAAGSSGQTLTSAGAAAPVWAYGSRMIGKIQWAATASCTWSTSSTSYGNFAADTDCPTPTVTSGLGVTASAPGTKIPAIVLSAIQTGTISIKAWGSFRANASMATTADFRFFDATSGGGDNVFTAASATSGTPAILGSITYGSNQGSTTINIQAKNRTGGGGNSTEIDARNETLTIEVWWSP